MDLRYEWRGSFHDRELNELHAEAFGHSVLDDDWASRVARHSLGWVCARDGDGMAGFVNVPWDGGRHAFILDTMVASRVRRRGVGARMVTIAAQHARAAGCEWLHVDFPKHLAPFYLDACGFTLTSAGLTELKVTSLVGTDGPLDVNDIAGGNVDRPANGVPERRG